MASERSTRKIAFKNEEEKAKAFYELVHSRAQFTGIGKNTFIISKKDCQTLKDKDIKYYELD